MESGIKVRLLVDLTKYAKGLIAGTEGVTVGRTGLWSRGSDRFITVHFSGIATLDVLWDSLDIIDEAVLLENEKREKAFEESLRSARDVVLHLGPRGGFRCLSYSYIDQESGTEIHVSNCFRSEAQRIMEILERYHIAIDRQTEK